MQTHFGDPCFHCGIPHDEIPVGACTGDPNKAKPIAYRSLGVRWDGYENFRIRWSTGAVTERWCHTSEQAPYWHFGHSDDLTTPPRYDPHLK